MASTGWESFMYFSNIWLSPSFLFYTKFIPAWQLSVKNYYTKFDWNLKNGLVTDSLSQLDDGHGVHAKHFTFPIYRMLKKQRMVNIMDTAGPLNHNLQTTHASKMKDWLKESDTFCMCNWYILGQWLSWVQQNWLATLKTQVLVTINLKISTFGYMFCSKIFHGVSM